MAVEGGDFSGQSIPPRPKSSRRFGGKRKLVTYAEDEDDGLALQTPARRKRVQVVDLTGEETEEHSGKVSPAKRARKDSKTVDLTADDEEPQEAGGKKGKAKKKDEEKRLKRYRPKPPQSYATTLERALTQRMYALSRTRTNNTHCPHSNTLCPQETIDLAGTTGNVYQVTITHVPSCTCPNFQKGNPQCKHILYTLIKILKAPEHLQYQLSFLTSELVEIFENAGPLPTDVGDGAEKDGKRKPVEGDCPICCCDMDAESESESAEQIVWCRAACGNNLHKTCFEQWAATKPNGGVTCPYCRAQWQADGLDLSKLAKGGTVGKEGYVNVAGELGLSGRRDYSTYHGFWVRREMRAGRIVDGDGTEEEPWYD